MAGYFDLIARVIGAHAQQKQLPVSSLDNVRSCSALATLSGETSIESILILSNGVPELGSLNLAGWVEEADAAGGFGG